MVLALETGLPESLKVFDLLQPTREAPMSQLTHIFCDIDDFCKRFEPVLNAHLLEQGRRTRQPRLSLSEIMTIIVQFHRSGYRTFKTYYTEHVRKHLRGHFPKLVSYNRFVELMPRALLPLCCFLKQRTGTCTGLAFMDSCALAVCHNRRIHSHKVFDGWAARGKTSVGWFFGFKLHLLVNDRGELLGFHLTPGNTDDRAPVQAMVKELFGKLYGDKGYISQRLFEQLLEQGLELITRLKKNMKNRLLPLWDKVMLRKRALIETIIDQLKNISQIEHSRHRSRAGFMVNLLAGLVAYSYQVKKPSLPIERETGSLLPALVA